MTDPWLGFVAEDKNVQIMMAEMQIRRELESREYCAYLEAKIARLEQWAATWKAAAKFNRMGWDWTCKHEGDYPHSDTLKQRRKERDKGATDDDAATLAWGTTYWLTYCRDRHKPDVAS